MSRDWTKVRCTKCKYHHLCRKKSIAKGSKMCLEKLGMSSPPSGEKQASKSSQISALLYNLSKLRGKK